MSVVYSASEVLRIAQEMERNGHRFYLESARAAGKRPVAAFFEALAADEARHLEIFEDMSRRVCDVSGCDASEEADAFLKVLAETVLFTPGSGGKQKVFDEEKALRQAIQSEKDAVLFYLEIMRFVADEDRPSMEKIIEEEKVHLRDLTERLNRDRG